MEGVEGSVLYGIGDSVYLESYACKVARKMGRLGLS